MLFHSTVFLFAFLPVTFALFYLLRRSHYSHAITALILASLFFYGWWEISFVPILLGSIAVNFTLGKVIKPEQSKIPLIAGLVFNLGLLGYFKYTGFFVSIFTGEQEGVFGFAQAALPLGISFFTFQQIAYLVDRYRNKTAAHGLREYMLFVCFFPQLIAGPIVHQQEMLPQNFYSPYKALNIVEFWRRWHITLSRFLRDYLYIPLGGNRKGGTRRYANLMTTMLLGGLWHGAGWTFIIWGGLHGLYLCISHGWQHLTKGATYTYNPLYKLAAFGLTFFAVVVAWVFFRALSLDSAFEILGGMAGLNGLSLKGNEFYKGADQILSFALMFGIAWLLPNTQNYMAAADPVYPDLTAPPVHVPRWRWMAWQANRVHAGFIAALFVISMMHMDRIHEFIYFQF